MFHPSGARRRGAAAHAAVAVGLLVGVATAKAPASFPTRPGHVVGDGAVRPRLVETSELLHVKDIRDFYGITGSSLSVAVLDTGIRTTHQDFSGRIVAQRNFTSDNGGDVNNATDLNGHGTHVTGVAAAGGAVSTGIAPRAGVVALKVFRNDGGGSFGDVLRGLQWIRENRNTVNPPISVAVISLTDFQNYTTFNPDPFQAEVQALKAAGVAVVCASGNAYAQFQSPGIGYPAIIPETIAVGAVYDTDVGQQQYPHFAGAAANTTKKDRLTPFSQRLHPSLSPGFGTDVLAPGANLTSAGIAHDTDVSTQAGTSQATPVVAGLVLLMQELHLRQRGTLPTVDQIDAWLKAGATTVQDGDDEDDNVAHPNPPLSYPRVNPIGAFRSLAQEIGANPPPEPVEDVAPTAPTGFSAKAKVRGRALLKWTDTSAVEQGFEVEYGTNKKKMKPLMTAGANVTQVNVTGLKRRKTYFFRVRAINQFGASPFTPAIRIVGK